MKKVLILAYDFPPYNSVAGQRPWSWYRHFAEHGWYPVVVTRHWDRPVHSPLDALIPSVNQSIAEEHGPHGTIIRVPNRVGIRYRVFLRLLGGRLSLLRRVMSFCAMIMSYFSVAFDNKGGLYHAARRYLRHNPVDAVIASGDPFVLFYYASLLSKEARIPWIADYRDCWSNHHEITRAHNTTSEKVLFKIFRCIEKRTVASASLITCPGKAYKAKISELFPRKDVRIVYNGYLGVLDSQAPASLPDAQIRISFGGTLYPFQPFETFAEGLEQYLRLQGEPIPVRVSFYGGNFYSEQSARILRNTRVASCFDITGRLPREELLKEYRKSDVLLLFANCGMISAKMFDYILAGRPILLVGEGGGEMEDLVVGYKLGYVCKDAGAVAAFLQDLHARKQQGLPLSVAPKEGLEFFSRRHQAGVMCGLLDGLTAKLSPQPDAVPDSPERNRPLPEQVIQ